MNDKRNHHSTADDNDRLVSAAYRDLANERTPQALNKSIRRRATVASKPGYLLSVSWMRPMAWAATVGLCLAIVFEMTQVPQPESAVFDMPNDAAGLPSAETRQSQNTRSSELLEATVPLEMPSSKADSVYRHKPDARQPTAVSVSAPTRSAEARLTNDAQPMREAPNSVATNQQALHCNADDIATPVTWLECIEELEKAGLTDSAGKQRALLQESFPDFNPL